MDNSYIKVSKVVQSSVSGPLFLTVDPPLICGSVFANFSVEPEKFSKESTPVFVEFLL